MMPIAGSGLQNLGDQRLSVAQREMRDWTVTLELVLDQFGLESVGVPQRFAQWRGWAACRPPDRSRTARSQNFAWSLCPLRIGGGTGSNDIASQRFPSRFAFAVALAWMGFSPRCASLVAPFDTSAMLSADCPNVRASAACRAINWLGVRLLANDMNAAEFRSIWRKANAPRGWLMVIMCAAIA